MKCHLCGLADSEVITGDLGSLHFGKQACIDALKFALAAAERRTTDAEAQVAALKRIVRSLAEFWTLAEAQQHAIDDHYTELDHKDEMLIADLVIAAHAAIDALKEKHDD